MPGYSLPERRRAFWKLSSQIAQIDNARLRSLFAESAAGGGWSRSQTLNLEHSQLFVKRIPVTDRELENAFSTRNLYDLPTFYNYGVGSMGLGVFRELVAHVKTTNWVLGGEIAAFPLMYHYRIMPITGNRADLDTERHKADVKYWGGSENIGRYLLDRASAKHELILFLEYVPHTLGPWLAKHPRRLSRALDELRATIHFLRKKGVIHFDAHYWNVLTDGEHVYLADFGLVLDRSFALSPAEQIFFRQHLDYDYGQVLGCLDSVLLHAYAAAPEQTRRQLQQAYGIPDATHHHEQARILLDNLEAIHRSGVLGLDKSAVGTILKYRPVVTLMGGFFSEMQRNNNKDTRYPHARLRQLLKETGFLSEAGSKAESPVVARANGR
jgi:hypothetical protein